MELERKEETKETNQVENGTEHLEAALRDLKLDVSPYKTPEMLAKVVRNGEPDATNLIKFLTLLERD
jgi:hypothetical protein